MEWSNHHFNIDHASFIRKHVAPFGIPTFHQTGCDDRSLALHHYPILVYCNLHVLFVVGQSPFHKLQSFTWQNSVLPRFVPTHRLGRSFLPGQATTIRAHPDYVVFR